MLNNIAPFEKLLDLRTNEKDVALKAYQHSVDEFESVAMELYSLLKEKEEIQEDLEHRLEVTIPVQDIHHYQHYLAKLDERIESLQRHVQAARSNMEHKQEDLSESFIEMKKFEKVVELKKKANQKTIAKMENNSLDEVSIQQYLRNRKR